MLEADDPEVASLWLSGMDDEADRIEIERALSAAVRAKPMTAKQISQGYDDLSAKLSEITS